MGTLEELKKKKKKKKAAFVSPESELKFGLGACAKNSDLAGALVLYKNALIQNLNLTSAHFDTLLHLCSNSLTQPSNEEDDYSLHECAVENGFRILDHMLERDLSPGEATITAAARLAAAKGDGDLAFELVKGMGKFKISPRLRTYGPALYTFCRKLEAEKVYAVEDHMVENGIEPEEPEISALLKVSAEVKRDDKVYLYLQRLRKSVKLVSLSTAEILERWFSSELACEVGNLDWSTEYVKEVIRKNGGGWHGLGWLGKGKWEVYRTQISSSGCCLCCGVSLVGVDIDHIDTQQFAESVATLAMQREAKANFSGFLEWVTNHPEYEVVVDGANVGFYQQNFTGGGFSINQIDTVVKELHMRDNTRWPLIVLHDRRVQALMEIPFSRQILEEWKEHSALYTVPKGSNDDWYWIYAAVKNKSFIVTNDEMRDHIFELLGHHFFLTWKERHQVHYTFIKGAVELLMPPPYSVVMQESEKGSWHVPLRDESLGKAGKASGVWLCISRCEASNIFHGSAGAYEDLNSSDQAGTDLFSLIGKRKRVGLPR